jgi:hypothetical protein
VANKSKLTFFSHIIGCLIFVLFSLLTEGCADNPSSIGKNFINPGDTQGVQIFDSYKDTMQIVSTNFRKYVNTSASGNLMVGKNTSYISKALIRFFSLSPGYDTSHVVSATLKLRYRNYYFPVTHNDSLGQIGFDIKPILQSLNFSTITFDSVPDSYFGNNTVGSYSGSPTYDTQQVNIPLDTAFVHNWLKYAQDTTNPVKNYGIVLYPNAGSNTLKSFYTSPASSVYGPILTVIAKKYNSSTYDTLNFTSSQTAFLASTSFGESPGVFKLQGGISYVDIFKFNTSKLPANIIVNDAQVIFSLDAANTISSNQTNFSISGFFVSDTLRNIETTNFGASLSNNQFSLRVIAPFQRWIQGQNNYGLMLETANQNLNLDLFSIFNETASDPSKRPHVIIKYSLRVSK